MAAVLARLSPWGFPVLYLGWAYLWWSPLFSSETSVWSGTNLVLFLVGGASPLLAGAAMAWVTGGADRVRDLWRRTVDTTRIRPRWWLFVLSFWLLYDLVMAGVAIALEVSDQPLDVDWGLALDPARWGMLLVLSFVFPAVEEIGLRGYWLDRLQERFTPAVAGVVNGAGWAVWHAPFVLFPGYYDSTTFDPELAWWAPMIVCETLLFVWVYNRTGRSILAVLVLHGMMNLTGEVLGISPELYPFLLAGHLLVAVAAIIAMRRPPTDAGGDLRPADGRLSPLTVAGARGSNVGIADSRGRTTP